MAKLNRTCGICHKKYSYCPSCMADSNKPTWMAIFCGDNCKEVYDVLNDYRYKKISKKEAFNKIERLDLSFADKLPKNFKEMLDEILLKEVYKKELIVEEESTESVDNVESKNVDKKSVDCDSIEENVLMKRPKRKKVKDIE